MVKGIEKHMSTPDEPLWLHIYGQERWHDAVRIHGTREALYALAEQLTEYARGKPFFEPEPCYFAKDGEGYKIEITVETEWSMEPLSTPYIDEAAGGNWQQREEAP